MANVKFLRGIQAKLLGNAEWNNTYSGYTIIANPVQEDCVVSFEDGTFYLATDTKRLFTGVKPNASNELVVLKPVSESITVVDDDNDLPSYAQGEGQWYYVLDYTSIEPEMAETGALLYGTGTAWIPVNKPNASVNFQSHAIAVADLDSSDGIRVTDGITINDVTKSANFDIKGDGSVTVSKGENSGDINSLIINGIKYTIDLALDDNTATLSVGEGEVDLVAGSDIEFDKTGSALTITGNHVSSINSSFGTNNKGYLFNATNSNGASVTATSINPKIKLSSQLDSEAVEFNSGLATLNAYTKDEIDSKLHAVDAMTYKGTVGADGKIESLPTDNVHIGDTYKLLDVNLVKNNKINDIVIANGTEYTAEDEETEGHPELIGTIKPDTLDWDLIPAGDDIEEYSLLGNKVSHGTALYQGGADGDPKGSFALSEGNSWIKLNDTVAAGSNVVAISHETHTVTESEATAKTVEAGNDAEFTVVDSITTDGAGHITAIATRDISIDGNKIEDVNVALSKNLDGAIVHSIQVVDTTDDNTKVDNSTIAVTSDSLEVEITASGKAASINVDLVWGSF